jgi:hypothetical protein
VAERDAATERADVLAWLEWEWDRDFRPEAGIERGEHIGAAARQRRPLTCPAVVIVDSPGPRRITNGGAVPLVVCAAGGAPRELKPGESGDF